MRFSTWLPGMGHDTATKMAEMAAAISKQVLKNRKIKRKTVTLGSSNSRLKVS
ncbi:MAG: hypothetical protein ABR909_13125 [Candidatus Bathyarchaeia archaeon]